MKFSLISDMHIDFPQPKTPYDKLEKTVIVAGDTSNGLLGLKFLNKLRNKGFRVFACDGNHEHYSNVSSGRDYIDTLERFRQDFPSESQLDLGLQVIAVNGWYQVSREQDWYYYMNDSRNSGLSADRVNQIAINEAEQVKHFLQRCLNSGDKAVVVTHTAPCTETLDPRFEGAASNEWYWSPYMRELIEKYPEAIAVWCHGHTHARNEAVVNGVRIVCNPRGYPGENKDWEPLTVEV